MTPDEQRGIDENIIGGRLIDAIALYRKATGSSLDEAKNVVQARAAQFNGDGGGGGGESYSGWKPAAQTSSPTQNEAAQANAAIRSAMPSLRPILISVAVIALIPILIAGFVIFGVVKSFGSAAGGTSGLGTLVTLATNPNKLGRNMLLGEPYYPRVVKAIEGDTNFQAALGSPVTIDESNIVCRTIRNGYTSRTANCTLPASGPIASGSVTIAVVEQPGSFGISGELTVGDRKIEMN